MTKFCISDKNILRGVEIKIMARFADLFSPKDMIVGTPWKRIIDSIVIGRYVGDNALAAFGSALPVLGAGDTVTPMWLSLITTIFLRVLAVPFTCSSIPLFIGFTSAGLPLGVTFLFLISFQWLTFPKILLPVSAFDSIVKTKQK